MVGWGWALDGASYILKTGDDTYSLVLDGTHHVLRRKADNPYQTNPGTWLSTSDPHLVIRRTTIERLSYTVSEYFTGNVGGVDQFVTTPFIIGALNPDGARDYLFNAEGWDVTTTGGITYHFSPATFMHGCEQYGGAWGDGRLTRIFQKFVLTSITDTNPGTPNRVRFYYDYDGTQRLSSCPANPSNDNHIYVRSARLKQVVYGVDDAVTIDLTYANDRTDRPPDYSEQSWFRFWMRQRLTDIRVKVERHGGTALHAGAGLPGISAGADPLLRGVTVYGQNEIGARPATVYTYTDGNAILTGIGNGYGGQAVLAYDGACPTHDASQCRLISQNHDGRHRRSGGGDAVHLSAAGWAAGADLVGWRGARLRLRRGDAGRWPG